MGADLVAAMSLAVITAVVLGSVFLAAGLLLRTLSRQAGRRHEATTEQLQGLDSGSDIDLQPVLSSLTAVQATASALAESIEAVRSELAASRTQDQQRQLDALLVAASHALDSRHSFEALRDATQHQVRSALTALGAAGVDPNTPAIVHARQALEQVDGVLGRREEAGVWQ